MLNEMLRSSVFRKYLKQIGIKQHFGVPDSLLKDYNSYLSNECKRDNLITANEGTAIAAAAGHYMATCEPAMVFLQNSGLGNCMNPLLSLTHSDVYKIPFCMMIGWRGELTDEPQHMVQGRCMLDQLDAINIPWSILPKYEEQLPAYFKSIGPQHAIIVRKGTFEKYRPLVEQNRIDKHKLSTESVFEEIVKHSSGHKIIASTGFNGRLLLNARRQVNDETVDFLTVGSMGHSSSIAAAIARKTEQSIVCIDGDGSIAMHMGNLLTNVQSNPHKMLHIVLNNGKHASVGNQDTGMENINITALALTLGYDSAIQVTQLDEIEQHLTSDKIGLHMVVVDVNAPDPDVELPRPLRTPEQTKEEFMKFF